MLRAVIGSLVLATYCLAQTSEDIRRVANDAWAADNQRFTNTQLIYNVHGNRLFEHVHDPKLESGGTYPMFIRLLDNYIPHTGIAEPPCAVCRTEENNWLDAVINSGPMQVVWTFLRNRGLVSRTHSGFRQELWDIWFQPYSRSRGPLDSSGFEHVFLGEIRDGAVTGFHNWVFAYLEEKSGDFNFENSRTRCVNRTESFSFFWLGYRKPRSSFLMGTSPELELALYMLCFRTRIGSNCPIRLGGLDMSMTTWDYQGRDQIGSAHINCS